VWMTRIYESLLVLYPADYRAKFSNEMLETFSVRRKLADLRGDGDLPGWF